MKPRRFLSMGFTTASSVPCSLAPQTPPKLLKLSVFPLPVDGQVLPKASNFVAAGPTLRSLGGLSRRLGSLGLPVTDQASGGVTRGWLHGMLGVP